MSAYKRSTMQSATLNIGCSRLSLLCVNIYVSRIARGASSEKSHGRDGATVAGLPGEYYRKEKTLSKVLHLLTDGWRRCIPNIFIFA